MVKRVMLPTGEISRLFVITKDCMDAYLRTKLEQGVTPATVAKYKTSLMKLLRWLEEDPSVTKDRLIEWRREIEDSGCSKQTVQNHVKIVNDFLRTSGRPELCIPKPLRIDIRGQAFGYLTALEPTDKRKRKDILWRCICKCGREKEVPATMLLSGNTTSCGCLNVEILQHANKYVEGTSLRQALEDKPVSTRAASGYTGVVSKRGKWQAVITYKGVHYCLGTYEDIKDAVKARALAKEKIMEDAARLYEKYADSYEEQPPKMYCKSNTLTKE